MLQRMRDLIESRFEIAQEKAALIMQRAELKKRDGFALIDDLRRDTDAGAVGFSEIAAKDSGIWKAAKVVMSFDGSFGRADVERVAKENSGFNATKSMVKKALQRLLKAGHIRCVQEAVGIQPAKYEVNDREK